MPIDDQPLELINQAGLPEWSAMPPRIAVAECLVAAEAVNDFVTSLDEEIVSEALTSGRERLVDRSIHRNEHLEAIEAAFPGR